MNNVTTTTVESWFIPLDILAIIFLGLHITITVIYLCIIIWDKTCHTVRMMLFTNTCLTGLACASMFLALTVFTLHNDIKQIGYQDSMCVIRGYLSYVAPASHVYSYVSSAIYQYMLIVQPTRLFWQSARTQLLLIILGWILAFLFPIPLLLTDQIIYNVDNQICEVPFRLSISAFYLPLFVFIIPMSLVMVLYFKLVRYVKGMGKNLAPAATLLRAQRNLTMVRRILILLQILLIAGCPMNIFYILSFFNAAPKYHSRIGYFFIDISLLSVMIVLFHHTESLKASAKKIVFTRRNAALPALNVIKMTAIARKNVETLD